MYVRMPNVPKGTPLPSPAKPIALKCFDSKKVWRQVLSYYVDDGALSGSFQAEAWAEIALHIRSTRPEPLLKVLGVGFDVHALTDDSVAVDSEMSDYFVQSVAMYEALPDAPPLSKHPVATPFCEPRPELELQPGDLAQHALSLIMKLLIGARMAGMHVVYAICALACQVTQWSKQSDLDLQRLFSYIKWNPFMIRGVLFPSEVDEICIGAYPDADLAGSRTSARSVSGGVAGLLGPKSWVALDWSSKRQTATSTSTSEAETISLCKLAKDSVMPLQSLWSAILGRDVRARYFEDNTATVSIIKTGCSVALRHLAKHHRISLSFAHEATGEDNDSSIECIPTAQQKGDILTKPLARPAFERACEINGIVLLPVKDVNKK